MCLWLVYMLDYTSITLGGGGYFLYLDDRDDHPWGTPPGIYKLVYSTLHSHPLIIAAIKKVFIDIQSQQKNCGFSFLFVFFRLTDPSNFEKIHSPRN